MKILIAVPTYENIYPDTFKSIYDLDSGGHELYFEFVRGYDVATARNRIVRLAQSYQVDYVLMVDNDMVLPHDLLVNMLESPMDVCLGYCLARNNLSPTSRTVINKFGEVNYTMEYMYTLEEIDELLQNGIHKIGVHGGGMACALIKTSVFDKLYYPYFKFVEYDNGEVLSEDLYFCEQCHANGVPIYMDTRAKCGHMFRYVI